MWCNSPKFAGDMRQVLGFSMAPTPRYLLPTILFWQAYFFAATAARATSYFVAAAGSDSNSGTSSGSPWQTIAKVNGSTFLPGDSILFNRGDAWYGTSLVIPSSGSSGSPITIRRLRQRRESHH